MSSLQLIKDQSSHSTSENNIDTYAENMEVSTREASVSCIVLMIVTLHILLYDTD